MRLPRLIREAATMISGNVVAQAVAMLAYLFITRIYPPEEFGLFNVLFSYVEILIILSTCKYELAIVPQKHDADALLIARFAMRLNAVVSAALLVVAGALVLLLGGRLSALCLLIPPIVFFCGTSRVYNALLNRLRTYRPIAAGASLSAVATALLKVLLGVVGMQHSGLMVGSIAGQATGNAVLRHAVGSRMPEAHLPLFDLRFTRRERTVARRERNYPFFVASRDFINSLSAALPFMWLGLYFDSAAIGLYALARTFTLQPAIIVGVSVEKVLYSHMAQRVNTRQRVWPDVRRFLLLAFGIGLPLTVAAYFCCGSVFAFCFGERWAGCEVYVQAMLPQMLLSLVFNPLGSTSNLFGKQGKEFGFFVALLALRVAALGVGIVAQNFELAVWLYSAVSAVVYAAVVVWYVALVRHYDRTVQC